MKIFREYWVPDPLRGVDQPRQRYWRAVALMRVLAPGQFPAELICPTTNDARQFQRWFHREKRRLVQLGVIAPPDNLVTSVRGVSLVFELRL